MEPFREMGLDGTGEVVQVCWPCRTTWATMSSFTSFLWHSLCYIPVHTVLDIASKKSTRHTPTAQHDPVCRNLEDNTHGSVSNMGKCTPGAIRVNYVHDSICTPRQARYRRITLLLACSLGDS